MTNANHEPKQLWVAMKVTSEDGKSFEFAGVFSTEEKAVAACRAPEYCIGPASLDEELPDEHEEWPGAYYPIVAK